MELNDCMVNKDCLFTSYKSLVSSIRLYHEIFELQLVMMANEITDGDMTELYHRLEYHKYCIVQN